MAPSFTHGTVLRIEPPLIADAALCDHLIGALKRLLDLLQRGELGELLGHLMGGARGRTPSQSNARARQHLRPRSATPTPQPARFAFVAHLLGVDDLRRFDPTVKPFDDTELETLRSRITEFMKPCPLDELAVQSADGRKAVGELIALPYLPSELVALPQDEAVQLVQNAVNLGAERGAEVIGLAGFASIVTFGGLAVQAPDGVRVTSGNSYTAWSAMRAVEAACDKHGIALGDCKVAIVGATGAIGHALSSALLRTRGRPGLDRQPPGRKQSGEIAGRRRGLQAARGIACRFGAQIPRRVGCGASRQPACGFEYGNNRHNRYRAVPSQGGYCADCNECRASFHLGASSEEWRHGVRCFSALQRCIRSPRRKIRLAMGGWRPCSSAGSIRFGASGGAKPAEYAGGLRGRNDHPRPVRISRRESLWAAGAHDYCRNRQGGGPAGLFGRKLIGGVNSGRTYCQFDAGGWLSGTG